MIGGRGWVHEITDDKLNTSEPLYKHNKMKYFTDGAIAGVYYEELVKQIT